MNFDRVEKRTLVIIFLWFSIYPLYKLILFFGVHNRTREILNFSYLFFPKIVLVIVFIGLAMLVTIRKISCKYHYLISLFILILAYTTHFYFYLHTPITYGEDRAEWLILSEKAKEDPKFFILNYQQTVDYYVNKFLNKKGISDLEHCSSVICRKYKYFHKDVLLYCCSPIISIAQRVIQHPFIYPLVVSVLFKDA